jgi:hypothetical protein
MGTPLRGLKSPHGSHNFDEEAPSTRRALPELDEVVNQIFGGIWRDSIRGQEFRKSFYFFP